MSTVWDNLMPLCFPHTSNSVVDYFHKQFLPDMSDCFKPRINVHVNLLVSGDGYVSFLSQMEGMN